MRNLFLCLLMGMFIYGCSARLNTLINLSREQASQRSYIAAQDKKFSRLLKDVEEERVKKGLTTQQAIGLYGEPILIRDSGEKKVFVYRGAVDFSAQEKAYLYFDQNGKLESYSSQPFGSEPSQD